ncbi:MAG: hypothetical protein ABFR53_07605 [Actinomycetota bacterium]
MSRERISHWRAAFSAVMIMVYFAVFTAWLPSYLLRSPLLSTAPRNVADGIVAALWGAFFVAGIVALRWAQDRELI